MRLACAGLFVLATSSMAAAGGYVADPHAARPILHKVTAPPPPAAPTSAETSTDPAPIGPRAIGDVIDTLTQGLQLWFAQYHDTPEAQLTWLSIALY